MLKPANEMTKTAMSCCETSVGLRLSAAKTRAQNVIQDAINRDVKEVPAKFFNVYADIADELKSWLENLKYTVEKVVIDDRKVLGLEPLEGCNPRVQLKITW